MSICGGFFNERTGDRRDGNFYCSDCGGQVPVGYRHHHAADVPKLKARLRDARREALDDAIYAAAIVLQCGPREPWSSVCERVYAAIEQQLAGRTVIKGNV